MQRGIPAHARDVTLRGDGSAADQDDVRREAQDLLELVAHVHDRDPEPVTELLQVGQHLLAAGLIDRGERLVEQQQPRAREQGAPDGDALTLAARELVRAPLEQFAQAEQLHDLVEVARGRAPRRAPLAVAQIAAHASVGKQARVLEDVPDGAALGREVDAAGVEEHDAVDLDASRVGSEQARHQVDQRGLPAPRRPEQRDHARRRRVEGHVEREGAAPLLETHREHQRPIRLRTQRASDSDASSPASPSEKEIAASRAAAASPPGCWSAV